ncbi:PilW family protein [Noviherbaspirillum pedocola]|uniref:PilW family protein n=1 Tax=Noviherbaspirillum pedocola TaxID=2801341 RepID=UPI002D802823|nr:PilW family protein [Noviherbaspirillum pedocola]
MTRRRCRQQGLSLSELMVAMAVGLLLILAACAVLLATRTSYLLNEDRARLNETGRFAIDAISRAVRQAGYLDPSAMPAYAAAPPAVQGLDARGLKTSTEGIAGPWQKAVNGSDVLALHFDGADDGGILNCAGAAVPAGPDRGWSIFHVAEDARGEPELRCKYRGASGWKSDAIARGVESFQVLYGIDTEGDGLPHRYMTATAVDAAAPGGALWRTVAAIRIGLLVHGAERARPGMRRLALFGAEYARRHPEDAGAMVDEAMLPEAARGLARRIFTATIPLRNGSAAP